MSNLGLSIRGGAGRSLHSEGVPPQAGIARAPFNITADSFDQGNLGLPPASLPQVSFEPHAALGADMGLFDARQHKQLLVRTPYAQVWRAACKALEGSSA